VIRLEPPHIVNPEMLQVSASRELMVEVEGGKGLVQTSEIGSLLAP
jgi:hypothetical protein